MSGEIELLRSRPKRGKQEAKDWAQERVRIVEIKAEACASPSKRSEVEEGSAEELVKGSGAVGIRKFVEKTLRDAQMRNLIWVVLGD